MIFNPNDLDVAAPLQHGVSAQIHRPGAGLEMSIYWGHQKTQYK